MRFVLSRISTFLLAGIVLLALPSHLFPQESVSGVIAAAADNLPDLIPDTPQPQDDAAAASQQAAGAQSQGTQQQAPDPAPAQSPSAQDSSSSQSPAPPTAAEKSAHDKAQEQLQEQEKQRLMGVMATFNTTRNKDALPLSPGQKFQLFFKSSTDPWPFLLAAAVSGIGQADDSYAVWGQGVQGYAKRYGAAYSDAFIGNFFGNAVLPSVLHEDPRYFQKGTGSFMSRFFWAAGSTVWCKRDRGGWGPNYSNVVGNLIGAAISNVYYPASEHTVSNTINDGLTVSAEGIVGAELIEFWPDVVRHHRRKQAEKLARQAAQKDAGDAAQPAPQAAPQGQNQ